MWKIFLMSVLISLNCKGAEIVLPYANFGSQVLAYKIIGKEWWQWLKDGEGQNEVYDVRVVVYWSEEKKDIIRRYPVIRESNQDYRYITLDDAVTYLEGVVKEWKDDKEVDIEKIEKTLAVLKIVRAKLASRH